MQRLKLLTLFLGVMMMFQSCEKDDTPDRIKFLGTFSVVESCPGINVSYNMIITESSTNEEEVIITNFGDFSNGAVRAQIKGNDIIIPSQIINISGNAINISNGTGNLNGNILVIQYSFAIGTQSRSCAMNCTKL